jgi:uncharacterized protein
MLSSFDPMSTLAGFLVGLLVGQTGMGGGSLMTPLLILLFGVHPATAVGTDLLYASATKIVGTVAHGLNHSVNWRIVGLLASGSVPATVVTLLLLSRFDISGSAASAVISKVLGAMLLFTALSLVFRRHLLGFAGMRLSSISPHRTMLLTVLTAPCWVYWWRSPRLARAPSASPHSCYSTHDCQWQSSSGPTLHTPFR